MSALTIKDLSRTEELDRSAMAGVRGGTGWIFPYYDTTNVFKSKIDATQYNQQMQSFSTAVGNNVALVDKFKPHVDVHGTQSASNNINVGGLPYLLA